MTKLTIHAVELEHIVTRVLYVALHRDDHHLIIGIAAEIAQRALMAGPTCERSKAYPTSKSL